MARLPGLPMAVSTVRASAAEASLRLPAASMATTVMLWLPLGSGAAVAGRKKLQRLSADTPVLPSKRVPAQTSTMTVPWLP